MQSNGSSSMAAVCAGSLALMDAGVPIKSPTAGVAIGLVTKLDQEDPTKLTDYRILTDIMDIEDRLGDMDLKVASTSDGITAIQADIKTFGLPAALMYECIDQAALAINPILEKMNQCMSTHRLGSKSCWPVSRLLKIDPDQRERLKGSGNSNLTRLRTEFEREIYEREYCLFQMFAPSQTAMADSLKLIADLLENDVPKFEFGGIYPAKIVSVKTNGIEVKLYDTSRRTFIHSTMLSESNILTPVELGLNVGDTIDVKYFGPDPVNGYLRLARIGLEFSQKC